ncbi:esterase FE4-like [Augochlora pura]
MEKTITTIKRGKLRGALHDGVLTTPYIAFHKIPLAAPPIAELQFKHCIVGDEDCPYLNVYTNSLSGCKPVMVWLRYGALIEGSGLLNLQHNVAPGNQGVKDVIAGLEWIKNNIANLGDDPNSVTVASGNVGAAMPHCLTISSRVRGGTLHL